MEFPRISTACTLLALAGATLCWAQKIQRIHPDNLAPFVPTPEVVAERMLDLADLKEGETLFDLGCGDGRILFLAAQKFKAKAIGVELSPRLVEATKAKAEALGLRDQVKVIQGNLLDVDLAPADVVTIYLMRLSNERLKPNLQKHLKPGARVVSHDYEIMGWKPNLIEKVTAHRRAHTIYVYRMPPTEE